MGPAPYDVTPAALDAAQRPLGPAETAVRDAAARVDAASSAAAAAAGDGPLDSALASFGEDTATQANERADMLRQLGQNLGKAAESYRADDATARGNLDGVMRPGG